MPITISTEATAEKNKINSTGVWLILLEFKYQSDPSIYVVYNNENIIWNGTTWLGAQFKVGDIAETNSGEMPITDLSIVDIDRILIPAIDAVNGAVGAVVTLRVVHSNHLDLLEPEITEELEVISTSIDGSGTITFKLGGDNLFSFRFPQDRYIKDHCRYVQFKGPECAYVGGETVCNRTFTRCKELNNQTRYGGFPAIGKLGMQI